MKQLKADIATYQAQVSIEFSLIQTMKLAQAERVAIPNVDPASGKLTSDERLATQEHTTLGGNILEGSRST